MRIKQFNRMIVTALLSVLSLTAMADAGPICQQLLGKETGYTKDNPPAYLKWETDSEGNVNITIYPYAPSEETAETPTRWRGRGMANNVNSTGWTLTIDGENKDIAQYFTKNYTSNGTQKNAPNVFQLKVVEGKKGELASAKTVVITRLASADGNICWWTSKGNNGNQAATKMDYLYGSNCVAEDVLSGANITMAEYTKVNTEVEITPACTNQFGDAMNYTTVAYTTTPANVGTFEGNQFTPTTNGLITVHATFNQGLADEKTASTEIFVYAGNNVALNTTPEVCTGAGTNDSRAKMMTNGGFDTNSDQNSWVVANSWIIDNGNPWCIIDLGDKYDIEMVGLYFFGNCDPKFYTVEFSLDKTNWTAAHDGTINIAQKKDREDHLLVGKPLKNTNAVRYVRFTASTMYNGYGLKIREIEVYGTLNTAADVHTVIATAATAGGAVTVQQNGVNITNVEEGTDVVITAIPEEHYAFVQWSDGSTVNPRTETVNDDITLTATFARSEYVMTATVNNADFGSATISSAVVVPNGSATFTAAEAGGSQFVNWTKGGVEVSTENVYTIDDINEDISLVANFAIRPFCHEAVKTNDNKTLYLTCGLTGEQDGEGHDLYRVMLEGSTELTIVESAIAAYQLRFYRINGNADAMTLTKDYGWTFGDAETYPYGMCYATFWAANINNVSISTNTHTMTFGSSAYTTFPKAVDWTAVCSDTEAPVVETITVELGGETTARLNLLATDNYAQTILYTVNYKVTGAAGDGTTIEVVGLSGVNKQYDVENLTPNTDYTFTITASDRTNTTEPMVRTLTMSGDNTAPSNITATWKPLSLTHGKLTLYAEDDRAGNLTYTITGLGAIEPIVAEQGQSTTIEVNGLTAGTTYNYTVTVTDAANNSQSNNFSLAPYAVNLALNKPASASASEGGNTADKAVDTSATSRWGNFKGANQTYSKGDSWLVVDLCRTANVEAINILWQHYPDYAGIGIQSSTNGTDWTEVYTYTGAKFADKARQVIYFETPVEARYLRVKNEGATQSWYMSIYNFEVFGTANNLVELDEEMNNASVISSLNGELADVSLNRSFIADGYWYTLCLPFDLSAEQMTQAFGAGWTLSKLENSYMKSADVLYLDFVEQTSLEAGVPYLFMPGSDVDAPILFNNVTINNAPTIQFTAKASMVGFYAPTVVVAPNYFLGDENYLMQNDDASATRAFRAYFTLDESVPANVSARVVSARPVVTGIDENVNVNVNKVLREGRIYIRRGDKVYTIHGQLVK